MRSWSNRIADLRKRTHEGYTCTTADGRNQMVYEVIIFEWPKIDAAAGLSGASRFPPHMLRQQRSPEPSQSLRFV
jgi:hypothetical protein